MATRFGEEESTNTEDVNPPKVMRKLAQVEDSHGHDDHDGNMARRQSRCADRGEMARTNANQRCTVSPSMT